MGPHRPVRRRSEDPQRDVMKHHHVRRRGHHRRHERRRWRLAGRRARARERGDDRFHVEACGRAAATDDHDRGGPCSRRPRGVPPPRRVATCRELRPSFAIQNQRGLLRRRRRRRVHRRAAPVGRSSGSSAHSSAAWGGVARCSAMPGCNSSLGRRAPPPSRRDAAREARAHRESASRRVPSAVGGLTLSCAAPASKTPPGRRER